VSHQLQLGLSYLVPRGWGSSILLKHVPRYSGRVIPSLSRGHTPTWFDESAREICNLSIALTTTATDSNRLLCIVLCSIMENWIMVNFRGCTLKLVNSLVLYPSPCIIFICFTNVLLPDSPAPNSVTINSQNRYKHITLPTTIPEQQTDEIAYLAIRS